MAQWVKALVAKLDNQSFILGPTCLKERISFFSTMHSLESIIISLQKKKKKKEKRKKESVRIRLEGTRIRRYLTFLMVTQITIDISKPWFLYLKCFHRNLKPQQNQKDKYVLTFPIPGETLSVQQNSKFVQNKVQADKACHRNYNSPSSSKQLRSPKDKGDH